MFGLIASISIILASHYYTNKKIYGVKTHLLVCILALILQQLIYINVK